MLLVSSAEVSRLLRLPMHLILLTNAPEASKALAVSRALIPTLHARSNSQASHPLQVLANAIIIFAPLLGIVGGARTRP